MLRCSYVLYVLLVCAFATGASAQINVPGDGSDGVFVPTANTEIDLSMAVTGAWNAPSTMPGKGIYDPTMWAVVFKYAFVNIPSGVTVTFKNHPSGAPVVWLVLGNTFIDGSVVVDGKTGVGVGLGYAEAGPGGFRGGRQWSSNQSHGSGGFGPGGGNYSLGFTGSGSGSYGTNGSVNSGIPVNPTYGNAQIVPLIGGSGGSGYNQNAGVTGGGGGGGAILIASRTTIRVNGNLRANGGSASHTAGSGGAIRLIADRVEGSGNLRAFGPDPSHAAGEGRIRVEANVNALADGGDPLYTFGAPGNPPLIWAPSSAPTLTPKTIAAQAIPADPRAQLQSPTDVSLVSQEAAKLILDATNVPLTSTVEVRVVPTSGETQTYLATLVSGNATASTWCAILELPNGVSAIQARAILP